MTARVPVATFVLGVSVLAGVPTVDAGDREEVRPAFSSRGGPASVPARVQLVWLDLAEVPVSVGAIARSEAASILERMGVEVAWRRARPGEPARDGEIRVVVVDRLLREPDTGLPILGATSAESRTYPVLWLHLAAVRATLGLATDPARGALSLRQTRDLGVALGRVVAHESVHVVAPALAHGRGLMARALGRDALTASRIGFEPGVAVVVLASLRGVPVEVAPATGLLAAAGAIGEIADEKDEAGIADAHVAERDASAGERRRP